MPNSKQSTDKANMGGVGTGPLSKNQGEFRKAARFNTDNNETFQGRSEPPMKKGAR